MHSPKVLLRTKSDLQASQLGCPLVVHLCQCAAVQDEFAEADVAAPAEAAAEADVGAPAAAGARGGAGVECGPRLCHVRLHAHYAHFCAQPKHLIVKSLFTGHIYRLDKNCEHLFAGKGLK